MVLTPAGFSNIKILIVGDLMLDRYIAGDVTRISPEAPVPVLQIQSERLVPGGAANVALNVNCLKAEAIIAGVVGSDAAAPKLLDLLTKAGISTAAVVADATRPTTSKTRVICGNHQIVRIDEESTAPVHSDALLAATLAALTGVHAVILSDYAKGVLSPPFLEAVIAACKGRAIPVLVDPKRTDYGAYAGATCITPNHKEFIAACEGAGILADDIAAAGALLRTRLNCDAILVTQGAKGMTLITANHIHHLDALVEEVFDVSGAGDTVIATFATALAAGFDIFQAVQLANRAAGIVVRKAGTAPIHWDELYEHSLSR